MKNLKFILVIIVPIFCSHLAFSDDQIDDLNMIIKIGDSEEDTGEAETSKPVDFDSAWKIYEKMKLRSLVSVYTKCAMIQMCALAMDLPISERADEVWAALIKEAGISSEWTSVFVRGLYIIELNNREALGANFDSKNKAGALLAVIDQEILYKSLERDKIIIGDTVKDREISKDDIDTLLATIKSIKDK
jgi:hypothetical protein